MKEFTELELIKALTNSGYLFESEIANRLSKAGYFVEANTSALDPFTGKSREIDIFAEYHQFDERCHKNKAVAATRFIFEIKNNDYPLVLMTNHDNSPNTQTWESLKIAETIPEGIEFDKYNGYFEKMLNSNLLSNIFTQYCSFEIKKNGDLMASHPESLYSGLTKLVNHCEDIIDLWNNKERSYKDDFLRNFLYLPVLLIKKDLFELRISEDSKCNLDKVEFSQLLFNYHYKNEPKLALIPVMTEKYLAQFLEQQRNVDSLVVEYMIEFRKGFV